MESFMKTLQKHTTVAFLLVSMAAIIPAYGNLAVKEQEKKHIIVEAPTQNNPKIPSFHGMDISFIPKAMAQDQLENYKQKIRTLNIPLSDQDLFTKKLWDIDYYSEKHYPVVVGTVENEKTFSLQLDKHGLRFLDLPIYMPNQGWRIPPQLEQFKEIISKAVAYEYVINPNFKDSYYVYITVDQGIVPPHTAQRRSGWHGDSYLKIDTSQKNLHIETDDIYVAADNCPTPFLAGPFPLEGIDPENVDAVLERFATIAKGKTPDYYPSYTILKMDPYCVHNVGFNEGNKPIHRTFVKISFSKSKYRKLGNAHNQLFVYDWPMIPRHNVPYSSEAISQSAHRKDRDLFLEINPKEIDFTQPECSVPWAKPTIKKCFRINPVHAVKADEGEVLQTKIDDFLITIAVAGPNDWKVTNNDDTYFLSDDIFKKIYTKDSENGDQFLPIREDRSFVELSKDVRFMAPWGSLQYAKAGDMLIYKDEKDTYTVPHEWFQERYQVVTEESIINNVIHFFTSTLKTFTDFISTIFNQFYALFNKNNNLTIPTHHTEHQQELYALLTKETQEHINYLSSIGLGERAQGIRLNWFHYEDNNPEDVNLASFTYRTSIPQEVLHFDAHAKNTLITTDPNSKHNNPEDLKKILDIRLYPTLRNLIKQNKIEIFLGTKREMVAYYKSIDWSLLFEFLIPSSATYYLAESSQGELCVIMAGLSSFENTIAQLITLKLADVKIENIEIIGNQTHFGELVTKDIDNIIKEIPELTIGNNILVVAGCGLEVMVSDIIKNKFQDQLTQSKSFKGNIVSLIYMPLIKPVNNINGLISLHLSYGEIMEKIIEELLNRCNCKYVFTGGAGGYIPSKSYEQKPPIGSYITITKSMNEHGQVASLDRINSVNMLSLYTSPMHLQIPSIFFETYEWLEAARRRGNSVDVETFYIIRAIQDYNAKHPQDQIKAACGYFLSDYVGEQPLREYSKVYLKYKEILSEFLQNTLTH